MHILQAEEGEVNMEEKNKEFQMNREQRWLLCETMKRMDAQYDAGCKMLGNEKDGHGVRVTAHYAVGLLARGAEGDRERAAAVLNHLLDMQYRENPLDAFYGGFPQNDRQKMPSKEPYPGNYFTAYTRYYMEKWGETILANLKGSVRSLACTREIKDAFIKSYQNAVTDTVPLVWKSFDPNWREFIGTDMVMILSLYEAALDEALIKRLEAALERAVYGSLRRYRDHICPMNTNIELMHILICAYLGERTGNEALLKQALAAADQFKKAYREFHSVGEYNSSTYYSVDLMALSAWQLLKTERLRRLGAWLEEEIWKDIAVMYQPLLQNLCGPFSRSYELDMSIHSLMHAMLYLGLGEKYHEKPGFNCELAGNIAVAILGVHIPEECRESLICFTGERQVETKFRELMERNHPDDDTSVCTATAWIAEHYMLGALTGSRNTSHQLRSAAAFWKAPDGKISNMALLRREPGEAYEHLRTIYFDNRVEKNHMEINITSDLGRDIELVFEVMGENLTPEMFGEKEWSLPGMTIAVADQGMEKKVNPIEGGMEVVYLRPWSEKEEENRAAFAMDFFPG